MVVCQPGMAGLCCHHACAVRHKMLKCGYCLILVLIPAQDPMTPPQQLPVVGLPAWLPAVSGWMHALFSA